MKDDEPHPLFAGQSVKWARNLLQQLQFG